MDIKNIAVPMKRYVAKSIVLALYDNVIFRAIECHILTIRLFYVAI